MVLLLISFLSFVCVAHSSYFTVSTYATTSDTALYSSAGSTLDVFTPISGVMKGSYIGTGTSTSLICQDTSSTQTTTSRTYIFLFVSDFVKMVRVQFTLTSGIIYWKAINARYYSNTAYGSTCSNVVGVAFPGGSVLSVATCDSCDNYGVASMVYDISNAPTSQPSTQPSSAPTAYQTYTYNAYVTTSDVSLYSKTGLTTLSMFNPITFTAYGAWVTYGTIGRLLCQDTNSAQTSTSRVYIFSWTEDGYVKMIKVQFTLSSSTIYYKAITARYTSSSYGSDCTTMVGTGYPSATTEPIATCDGCDGYGISSLTYIITDAPTSQPSSRPSSQPSRQPSRQPSVQPTSRPSRPSSQPSSQPSSRPSTRPTNQPSVRPSSQPSNRPSTHPSSQPSCQPTNRPSYHQGGSSITVADYLTTSDALIYYNPSIVLDELVPESAVPWGGMVSTYTDAMWCKDTTSSQTSTSQTYVFTFVNQYLKFVRVVFTLSSGRVYWKGTEILSTLNIPSTISCSSVLSALSGADSGGALIATCDTCDGYGLKSFVFYVGNDPTLMPTALPTTTAPSLLPTVKPSAAPSVTPSVKPTVLPTTTMPSQAPTCNPTVLPTIKPSCAPTVSPTLKPVVVNAADVASISASSSYRVTNAYAFAGLNSSGHVFTWGHASKGGDSSGVSQYFKNVTAVVSSHHAFVALNSDGSVVAWGEATSISGWSEYLSGTTTVASVYATESAFALLTTDGAVHAFGHSSHGGRLGDVSSDVSSGVVGVVGNAGAFAAWKSDGSVYCWGSAFTGGGVSSATMSSLVNVVEVYASRGAFAARLSDGSVLSWGDRNSGGVISAAAGAYLQSSIVNVLSAANVFTAVRSDTSLVSWGVESCGGSGELVDVVDGTNVYLAHTSFAVAALKSGGGVVAWGNSAKGGSTSGVSVASVSLLYGNSGAFAVVDSSGAVTAWGSDDAGGDTSSVASDLTSDVVSIAATNYAFAALKSDGSVVVWGDASYGGSVSADVSAKLVDVVKVCSNDLSFTAIKSDGEGIVWGHSHVTGGCGDACVLENAVLSTIGHC